MSACQRTGGQKGSVAHERSPVMNFQLCPFLPRHPHLRRAWDRRQRPASGFCAVWGKGGCLAFMSFPFRTPAAVMHTLKVCYQKP